MEVNDTGFKLSNIYIVHCIDAEGPLFENFKATLKRIRNIFDKPIKKNYKNLDDFLKSDKLLSKKEIKQFKFIFSKHNLNYNKSWVDISKMIDILYSEDFLEKHKDSIGNKWIYNFFILDHVFYEKNPRKRILGFHKVYDYYLKKLNTKSSFGFHYHPHSLTNEAHHSGTSWFDEHGKLNQVISRKIIDKEWFPAVNRCGFHVTKPDSHWFLEQYIPFDISNNSSFDQNKSVQTDISLGNYGDWTRSTKSWVPYYPSHEDYQVEGDCKRLIARCLNLNTRYNNFDKKEAKYAFSEANKGKNILLGLTNHDHRDITYDVETTYNILKNISKEYPKVKFIYSDAVNAFRKTLKLRKKKHIKFKVKFDKKNLPDKLYLYIESDQKIFGSQPFFCFKDKRNKYYHDNLITLKPGFKWRYCFFLENVLPLKIKNLGFASNNDYGRTTIVNFDENLKRKNTFLN